MKIILAIDGSSSSDVAVEEVARRLWPAGSELHLISVVEPPASLTAEPWGNSVKFFEEVEMAERQQASAVIERAILKIRPGGEPNNGLKITTDILKGSPKRAIVEEAERWGADLIVVGSHGYRSWERMLLGSVSQAVAMHAECSVEIVRHPRQKKE